MTTRYEQINKRIQELSNTKRGTRWYNISIETDWQPLKCRIYKTPDEALQRAYQDATRHHAEYMCVNCDPFSDGQLMGEDVGFSLSYTPRQIFKYEPESFGGSFLHCFGMFGSLLTDLEYPQRIPELKILDALIKNELEWVQTQTKCKTVEEYKQRKTIENPDLYQKGYLTDNEKLSLLYAAAGYL